MSAEKKKIRCRTYARKQRIQEKYRIYIVIHKQAKVKRKGIKNFEMIKNFDIEQMAYFLTNVRFTTVRGRGTRFQQILAYLESEAFEE